MLSLKPTKNRGETCLNQKNGNNNKKRKRTRKSSFAITDSTKYHQRMHKTIKAI